MLCDKGLSQTEAARQSGVSVATINLLINKGIVPKNPEMQKRLSALFGMDVTEVKPEKEEVTPMLSLAALKHFKLFDPFINNRINLIY